MLLVQRDQRSMEGHPCSGILDNQKIMSAIFYYLALPFIYVVSYLPPRLMYLLSDLLYILVYKVIGYRKKVVTKNLRNSFPDKPEQEIDRIRREFYRYFCDLSLESLWTLSISPKAVSRHFKWDNHSVFEPFYKKQQSVIMVMGHLGNWELAGAYIVQVMVHQLYVIYHPLTNPHLDNLLYRMRTRSGMGLYPMKETFRGMLKNRDNLTVTAFLADQTPSPDKAHWMTFLNQDTPVFKGTENISRKLGYPIIYMSIIREKRGSYRIHTELLAENPADYSENEITEMHTKRLERDIIDHPETWLWSHRRWKHKRSE